MWKCQGCGWRLWKMENAHSAFLMVVHLGLFLVPYFTLRSKRHMCSYRGLTVLANFVEVLPRWLQMNWTSSRYCSLPFKMMRVEYLYSIDDLCCRVPQGPTATFTSTVYKVDLTLWCHKSCSEESGFFNKQTHLWMTNLEKPSCVKHIHYSAQWNNIQLLEKQEQNTFFT